MAAVGSVSVVVASRDRPEQLRGALAAIRAAMPAGTEVVVVDSASTGAGTRQVTDDAGARYLRCDRPGVSRARNLGLETTQAEIVAFTDDDCRPAPGWLDALARPFADREVAL